MDCMFNVTLEYLSTLSALTMLSGKSGIYSITAPSQKVYIGSAVNIPQRWRVHLSTLRGGKHHNLALQRAFVKYGELNMKFAVLEFCAKEVLIEREQFYMDVVVRSSKYNIAQVAGNCLGVKPTAETRAKMSAARLGKTHTAEARAKMGAAKKGKTHTAEFRAMLSELNKGKTLAAETRAKISAAQKGRKHSAETRAKISARLLTSEHAGVVLHKKTSKWAARTPNVYGKQKTIGYFASIEEAVAARAAYLAGPETYRKPRTLSAANTSGHAGVSFCKSKGKWTARATVAGKRKSIGRFATIEEAVAARAAYLANLEHCKNG
jgi:group I intron endonuclease